MKNLKIIRNDEEYKAGLEQIEKLMERPCSSEGEEYLEVLSVLVEKYESENFPIDIPDPIEAIKFRMDQQGLSKRDLIPFIGSAAQVSTVLNRKTSLTLKMIRALQQGLGLPAHVLLKESPRTLLEETQNPHLYPLKELKRRGWLDSVVDLKNKAEEVLQDFLDRVKSFFEPKAVLFRKGDHQRKNAKMNPFAFQLWAVQVAYLSSRMASGIFQPSKLNKDLLRGLIRMSKEENGPKLAVDYLAGVGVRVVLLEHLEQTYLDGATFHLKDGTPVIGLTARYDRLDNFWFTLLHELGHVALHLNQNNGPNVFVDDFSLMDVDGESFDKVEKEADEFADENLQYKEIDELLGENPKPFTILQVAQKLELSSSIVAGRYRFRKKNYRVFASLVGIGEVKRWLQS